MYESASCAASDISAWPRWLGDIGGTNARFGWQEAPHAPVTDVHVLPCAEYPHLADAALAYLQRIGRSAPDSAAFGIANPVLGDAVQMTNHHWKFSVSDVRDRLGLKRLLFLNDFTALALALPTLPATALRQVGSGVAKSGMPVALIGAGTGLGVSGLIPLGYQDKWIPLSGEGGHVTLTAHNAREFEVIEQLRKRYGHVSTERAVCGQGLVDLYHALCDLKGSGGREITNAAQVLERATAQPDSSANEAIDLFCGFLGSAAGDLALTLGSLGGVYIGGGIVPRLGARFDASPFRERFESKGRFKSYLHEVPTWVIESPVSPALEGASRALSLGIW